MNSTLNKRSFRECIDAIVKSFPEEDVFESLIHFLTTSVEVRLDTVNACYVSFVYFIGSDWVASLGCIQWFYYRSFTKTVFGCFQK